MNRGFSILCLFTTLLIISFPFWSEPLETASGLVLFLGRFHPLVLHFPIVLFLLIVAIEVKQVFGWKAEWSISDNWYDLLFKLSFATILITTVLGFLLYRSGEYQGEMIRDHLQGAVLLCLTTGLAFIIHIKPDLFSQAVKSKIYSALIFVSAGLLFYTSHVGAGITHGKNFLTEHLSIGGSGPSAIDQKNPEELLVYQDMIVPFLDKRCYSCHNEYKTKGGLLMTSWADLNKGGKSEKSILQAGLPASSELYHRITLPIDDDDRMPPSNKPGLSQDEIDLLEWWIKEGASAEHILGEGPSDPNTQSLINRYLPSLYKSERLKARDAKEFDKFAAELKSFGEELGLAIEPDKESESKKFAVSMLMPPKSVNDETIKELLEYKEMYSKISLPGSEITDDALYDIAQMNSLRSVLIPQTKIKGTGLVYLKELSSLENLNLSNTSLTDEGLLNVLALDQLKKCYLMNTPINEVVLEAIRKNKSGLQLLMEEGPLY